VYERTCRPLFHSLLNLQATTTMENKQTKRSLEEELNEVAPAPFVRNLRQRSHELEHIMFQHYRQDHERQVDLKNQYKSQLEVVEERCTRLHQHGLGMTITIDQQAQRINQLEATLRNYERMSQQMWELRHEVYDDSTTLTDEEILEIIDLTTDEILEEEEEEVPNRMVEALNIQWPRANI